MTQRKTFLADTALFAGTLIVCLVVAEVVLRAVGIYGIRIGKIDHIEPVDDPILDFRLVPGSEWVYNGIPYRINAHGWRDHGHEYEKPDSTVRLVILGDSVLNGHGVKMEEVWAKQLEYRLNEGGGTPHFEVIMLAIGALNTKQEAHLLEVEGMKYDPDLILVGYVLNDPEPGMSSQGARERREHMGAFHKFKQMLKLSSVVFHSVRLIDSLIWRLQVAIGRNDSSHYIDRDYFGVLHESDEQWADVVAAFGKIRELADPECTPVGLVIFPVIFQLDNYPWEDVHSQVREAAAAVGFRVLDLLETYRAYPEADTRIGRGDHVHPNALGHRIAGDAVAKWLVAENLLPADSLRLAR